MGKECATFLSGVHAPVLLNAKEALGKKSSGERLLSITVLGTFTV